MRSTTRENSPCTGAWGCSVKGRGWLPLVGLNALIGSGVTLVLPAVLGRSVDSIVAGADRMQWLIAIAGLISLGIAASLIDAFTGATGVAAITTWLRHRVVKQIGLAAATAIAAIAPPAGSLVLLTVIDPALGAAFIGGTLLVLAVRWALARRTAGVSLAFQDTPDRIPSLLLLTAADTTGREGSLTPRPHPNGVVTWRILSRSGGQGATAFPMVAVLAVGGLQLVAGEITAGELFAAVQYAVLGTGLGSLTDVLKEIARAAEPLPVKSIAHRGDAPAAIQRHRFVA